MNSEKVKKIKKALECMSGLCKDSLLSICFECEIDKKYDEESACKEALTLINELESENERLVESCKNCHYIKDLEIANGHAKELKDRIAELEKENKTKTDTITDLLNKQEFYEKEKLKQFAERLKEKKTKRIFTKSQMNMAISNTVGMLGNLLKEGLSKEIVYVFISEAKKLEVNGSIKFTDLEKLGEEITKRIVSAND